MIKSIILAAGKGTRMKSDTPKVLHTIFDKNKKLLVNRIASLLTLLSKTVCLENCNHNGLPRKPIGFLAMTHNW